MRLSNCIAGQPRGTVCAINHVTWGWVKTPLLLLGWRNLIPGVTKSHWTKMENKKSYSAHGRTPRIK